MLEQFKILNQAVAKRKEKEVQGMYEIIFSPTGGTKKAAGILCKELDGQVEQIDLTDRKMDKAVMEFSSTDICLIAVPSYGGRVPGIASERIKRFQGNKAKAILVAVIGNRAYDDTLLELKDLAVEAGFVPVAAVVANAEHSIMRQFGAGRPDREDETELRGYAKQVAKLLQKETMGELTVPGNRPYRVYNGVPMKPKASKECTKCGICALGCPVGAIPVSDPARTEKDKCISCMRCIAVCPVQARSLSGTMSLMGGMALKKACAGRKRNELYLCQ